MDVSKARVRAYILSVLAWLMVSLIALKIGAVQDASIEIVTAIRLPRIILASAVGMGLAVAGAALQALFSNPLCEPYTLGISAGAALGAVLGMSLGLEWMVAGLAGTAFLGALFFAAILYTVSLRPRSDNMTILLSGVMLGFLGSSLVALWMAVSDSTGLQGAYIWLFGDLSRARLRGATVSGLSVLSLVSLIWIQSKDLDSLLMGEEAASALGVDVTRVRRRMIVLAALLIGSCVSAAGMIGFVGLVIPHFARRWVGALHFALIPFCGIIGAVVLTLADCGARVFARPAELPVGVVTALLGAPVFLWVMLKERKSA